MKLFILSFLILNLIYPQNDNIALPHFKDGYLLFSWPTEGKRWTDFESWNFTLISNNNLEYSIDEIKSTSDNINDKYIKIYIKGVNKLENILKQLPKDELIFWDIYAKSDNSFYACECVIFHIIGYCEENKINLRVYFN